MFLKKNHKIEQVFIHIGVHKTASTLLQKTLQLNRQILLKNGVSTVIRDTNKILKNQLRLFIKNKSSLIETKNIVDKYLISEQEKGINKIIISDENLLDDPPSVYFKRNQQLSFYPKAKANIEKLKSIFNASEIVWLLYTREQHTLIPSLYKDGLKYFRYSCTLDSFFAEVDENEFRYDILVDTIRKAIPNDRIVVKKYESILIDSKLFILDFLNVFTQISDIYNPSKKVNASMNLFQGALFRMLSVGELSVSEKKKIKQWINQAPNVHSFIGKSDLVLSKEQKEALIQKFKDDISYRK